MDNILHQTYLKDCNCSNGGIVLYNGIAVCRWCREPYAKGGQIFYEESDFKKEPELKWFVVPEEIGFGWKAIEQHIGQMGGYAGTKYFDTEEEAHSWIIENKPCLSLNEVVHLRPAWINNHYMGQLKELVKSKL